MSLILENVSREVDGVDYIRDANLTFEAGSFNVLLGRTLRPLVSGEHSASRSWGEEDERGEWKGNAGRAHTDDSLD